MSFFNKKLSLALLLALLLVAVTSNEAGGTSDLEEVTVKYNKDADVIYFNGKIFLNHENILQEGIAVDDITQLHGSGEKFPPGTYEFYYYLIISISLTLGAGVMSGLTVGYLSIDRLELEMKMQNGTETEKSQALAVLPVLEDHHYLLVTLLLANALCMEALPIFLDAIVPSAYAILISVVAVLFFGEVIPQAICTGPQQIKIGATLAPFIHLLKVVLGIVAYPIAKILDAVLGEHMTTRYSNNDLKALIELHSYHALEALDKVKGEQVTETGLQPYQTKMIKSVIDFRAGTVKKIMIPSNRIFTLNLTQKIDNKIARKITKAGFSRIPVYEKNDKNKVIGIMFIKTLIGLDLKEPKSISQLVNDGEVVLRKPIFVSPDEKLEAMLNQFIVGKSHMAIVTDKPEVMEQYMNRVEDYGGEISLLAPGEDVNESEGVTSRDQKTDTEPAKVLGLLTLEDLIEFLIKSDILDEADYDRDLSINRNPHVRVDKSFMDSLNVSTFIMENRSKIKNLVNEQVENHIKQNRKFAFRPEQAKSINFDNKDLSAPLLDKSKDDKISRKSSNRGEHHV